MEYATNGAGDYRIAALSARNSNGDSVTDVRYVSHKIYDGKPSLPGLPATFDREGKAQTLEVETLDAVTGLKATLLYTVFEDYPVLAKSVRLENTGSAASPWSGRSAPAWSCPPWIWTWSTSTASGTRRTPLCATPCSTACRASSPSGA